MSEDSSAPHRVAVVTGAGSGIGRAVAIDLAAAGMRVVATDIARDKLGPVCAACPPESVLPIALNVRDPRSVEGSAITAYQTFGRIDVLVNNAGVFGQTPALRVDEEVMNTLLDINLCGTLRCTAAFGRIMAETGGGRIINIASTSGLTGAGLLSVYAASKAGIIAATRSAACELAKARISVNAVVPGACDTQMLVPHQAWIERYTVPKIPAGRVATPEDVAEPVRFLATSKSPYMTGAILTVDGGMTSG